ncbi:MAG: glycosyltransferase family 1 protein [Candidatus Peregrinibacteria bacterium]|nr:glycosyltransferase family 1 protein [Candidatus Peregrinibacteria bacterium]MDZ4245143.1 glycosyltransferase family 1 protein [Candidatus Gracilibacteria bacterium]
MKIGIDLRMYSSQFTGIGRYCYELIENLIKIDHENDYVFFLNEPEYSEFKESKRQLLENGRNRTEGKQAFKAVKVDAPHYSLKEQLSFAKALKKEKLDLMHFTHFNAPILYRKPCIVTIHDLTLSFFPGKKFTKWYHRTAYHIVLKSILRRAKKIIAVSKNTELDLHRLYNFTRGKTVMIHEAVGNEFRALPMEEVGKVVEKFEIDKEYILYTGVHRDHKNVIGLIGGFAKLLNDSKFDGYLVITGKENPHYPEVRMTIDKLGLADNVKLVGLVEESDLIGLYNGASIYAYPSFYEGFGLPALEAFACGTPVCASNKSCLPDICGEAAAYFDPKNLDEMADKFTELLRNDGLRDYLIQKGKERLKDFSWEKMACETLNAYKKTNEPN